MKKAVLLLVAFTACVGLKPTQAEPQSGRIITVTAGTAIRLTTATTRLTVNSISLQMRAGGTGVGYVLWAQPGVTCATATAGQLVVELGASPSSTVPGAQVLIDRSQIGGTDLRNWCVDGSANGDEIVVTWDRRP